MIKVKLGKKRAVSYIRKLQIIRCGFNMFSRAVYEDMEYCFNIFSKYVASELEITEKEACEMLLNNQIEFEVEMGYLTKKERERREADKERKAQKKIAEFEEFMYGV